MSKLQLLAAGFSAILGVEVVTPDQGVGLPKLSINHLFRCTYIMRPIESVDPGEVFEIHVKTLTGTTITIQATNDFTVAELKAAVEVKENIPARQQRLVFSSQPLQDDETVQSVGIPPGGTLFLIITLRGGGPQYQLDTSLLDPGYDYDFTGKKDDGKSYVRGGFPYKRPYGWSRMALKVRGNPDYGDDDWLGPNESAPSPHQGNGRSLTTVQTSRVLRKLLHVATRLVLELRTVKECIQVHRLIWLRNITRRASVWRAKPT